MTFLLALLKLLWPFISTVAVAVFILIGTDKWMRKRAQSQKVQNSFARQLILIALTAIALIAVVLALPLNNEMKSQLFSLLGLALTVAVALSSTTMVSNAMAGIMSRAIGSFKVGDFVKSESQFGRITERGLFHTEIQTEDRDLVTVPNIYLMNNPVRVLQNCGTIVSASVSLGYDVDHREIEPKLIEAANTTGLDEPFVRVMELGDFSVTYRVAGFLSEVTKIVSTRSNLNKAVLDSLHQAGIEIASPSIMAQRPLTDGQQLVPKKSYVSPIPTTGDRPPEERMFDKAERAAEKERLSAEKEQLESEIQAIEKESGETDTPAINFRKRRIQAIERKLELMESTEE